MPPTRYHHGDLRRALILGAVDCIRERGVAALALREVARRAGVSHAAPYRHFADKEALLAAVAEDGFWELAAQVAEAAGRGTGAEGRLVEAAVGYVAFARAHPAHFEVMFRSGRHHGAAARDASAAAYAGVRTLVAGLGAEHVPSDEALDAATRSAWALAHGLAALSTAGRLGDASDTALDDLTRFAARALVAGLPRAAS